MTTAREEQIKTLRDSAAALRSTVKKARLDAAEWQRMADTASEKADRDEENARVWELLADALDNGQLDDIVVPLGTGSAELSNTRIHALQGRLMGELSDCDLDCWNIHCRELTAMWHKTAGGSREGIAIIAERLGITYIEKPRDNKIYAEAVGEIDGIPVKIWSLQPTDEQVAGDLATLDGDEPMTNRDVDPENVDECDAYADAYSDTPIESGS